MKQEERIKMFNDVFAPGKGEKILFLMDVPHDDIIDNQVWKDRRKFVNEWFNTFKLLGENIGFSVDLLEFDATGKHNTPLPKDIIEAAGKVNLVIAMTEFSATAPIFGVCRRENSITRAASMPMVEKRMEETAFRADYSIIKQYATALEKMLNNSVGAEILFSTGDNLFIDLRNRVAEADTGECTQAGQIINFPSGEGFKAPYEGSDDEKEEFGVSKTKGVMPVKYDDELVKYKIENNQITEIAGNGKKANEMREFFEEKDSHRNIAELGIGCNPKAVVTGNILEDEKVGLHIAYGLSRHIGGRVESDVHQDIVFACGCPIEGTTLILINEDGTKTELIRNAKLRYEILV